MEEADMLRFNQTWARPCALLGLGAALVLAPLDGAKADPTAYEVTYGDGASNLFGTVDLSTGAFTQTSTLSFIPTGLSEIGSNLYTSTFTGTAFGQVNPTTGAVTQISNVGLGGGEYLALGSTLNTIYALDASFNLYSVNPATGAATLIGPTGLSASPAYQLSTGSSVLYFGNSNELYSLNTLTGAATDIGATGLSGYGIDGLVSEGGVLYGGYEQNGIIPTSFYTIDTASGAATFLATQDPALGIVYGLAPIVPEPSTLTMFGLALLTFAAFRPRLLQRLTRS
jgi:PEP-CTERM motif